MPFSPRACLVTILALLTVAASAAAAAPEPAGAIYGSGFFVTANGTLATAAHVVQRCRRIVVEGAGSSPLDAQVLRIDPVLDVALLQVRNARVSQMLTLRREPAPLLGELVATLGFPFLDALQGRATFETGIVTGLAGLMGDSTNFRISIPLDGGFSGAPIVDRSGLVIGLARGFAAHGRAGEAMQPANINLAVTGPRLVDMLRGVTAARPVSTSSAILTPQQTADLLSRSTVLIRCLN